MSLNNTEQARPFNEKTSKNWQSEFQYNLIFLRAIEVWANDRLKIRGHLFLNELYEMLGMKHTRDGAIVGWISKPSSFVDLGINYGSLDIVFHFNVDGIIYDKIDEPSE